MLLWKLLRRHFSPAQLAGFFLANFFGLCILLTGIQFHNDILPVFTSGDSFMKKEYMVVTKHVGLGHTLRNAQPHFRPEEIRRLEEQSFTRSVGRFTPAQFDVQATVGSRDLGMTFSTDMFFESIPDGYIDTDLTHWKWEDMSDSIPVILPKNYLNLYNFGFAGSRGLPAISSSLVGMIDIEFRLRGTHASITLPGRVVGFSERLNTILVPQTFMDQANSTLSPNSQPMFSRLIVDVENPADQHIATFLSENHYETESGGGDNGRTAYFLRLVVSITSGVGLLICGLAFYVLLLSILLLLQKHTEKIDNLLLIGYAPGTVARPFHLLAVGLNLGGLFFAFLAVCLLRENYIPHIENVYPNFTRSSMLPTLLTGMLLSAVMILLNAMAINRKMKAVWRMHNL